MSAEITNIIQNFEYVESVTNITDAEGGSDAIEAVGEAITSLFNYFSKLKETQTTSELIRDKRRLSDSQVYAEKAINLAENRAIFLKSKYRRRFRSYVKKFREKRC